MRSKAKTLTSLELALLRSRSSVATCQISDYEAVRVQAIPARSGPLFAMHRVVDYGKRTHLTRFRGWSAYEDENIGYRGSLVNWLVEFGHCKTAQSAERMIASEVWQSEDESMSAQDAARLLRTVETRKPCHERLIHNKLLTSI